MKFKLLLMACIAYILLTPSVHAQDQCDTTAQCKATYGNSADDCANSQSDNSICMCGSDRCDATNDDGGSGSDNNNNEEERCDWYGREIVPLCQNAQTGWSRENGVRCISRNQCINGQPSDRGGIIGGGGDDGGGDDGGGDDGGGDDGGGDNGGGDNGGDNTGDQCNTTAQCRAIYGNTATDCQNSQSSNSICICGSQRCDANGGGDDGGGNNDGTVLLETGGLVAIEAESYTSINNRGLRAQWRLTEDGNIPNVNPDPDGQHLNGSSGRSYLEILPDTRVIGEGANEDPIIRDGVNTNFIDTGGDGPTLNYRVYFNTPGSYNVWLRAYSTGSEDNGAHVGINGSWPDSGEKVQFCSRNSWVWSSSKRDTGGAGGGSCGVRNTIKLNVPSSGIHTISVSMREDGFELDKIVMARDNSFTPAGTSIDEQFFDGGDNGGDMLGQFEIGKDLFVACFDLKEDTDDLHAIAATGTMLVSDEFDGVDYHGVYGCTGQQVTPVILRATPLFNEVFGDKWSYALADNANNSPTPRNDPNRVNALDEVSAKMITTLDNGGEVWIADGGQSDFSADAVRRVASQRPSVNLRRIHIVQHSVVNESNTRTADLNYVRNNTSYQKIDDGNVGNNGTPNYKSFNGSQRPKARSLPRGAGDYWDLAIQLADEEIAAGNDNNGAMRQGGLDFSDTVETTWIFGFNGLSTIDSFLNRFD